MMQNTFACKGDPPLLVQPMIGLIVKNRVQSRMLAGIRDALLPRLLSEGKIAPVGAGLAGYAKIPCLMIQS
jgi:hypothetical protein